MKNSKHNQNRAWASLLLVGTLLIAGVVPTLVVAEEVCEIPLFVKQNLVGANVMILADNSGSMNEATYHLAYDSDLVYSGDFSSFSTYFVSKTAKYTPDDFNSTYPSFPVASLVKSDNGQDGRYRGNYLNWIYYHATVAQRAAIPQVTRIQVLKEVLSLVIQRSARLRFGLTVFNNNDGGNVIGKCGVNHTSLQAQIAGITANTWTPLGESAETVLDYFTYDGPDAAIQVPCQYNFAIIITDGEPTMDLNVSGYLHDADGDGNDPGSCTSIGSHLTDNYDCSDHLDDVVYWMNKQDLRPDLDGDQNVATYVVGFHQDLPLLQQTADNGDGLFFYADNAPQLARSIEYAVQDILRRISAGSAVAVVSTERGTDDRLYRGKFMPIDWDGFLESYALPYSDGDAAVWEAGSLLAQRSQSSRHIFTGLGDQTYEFSPGNAATLMGAMNISAVDTAANLIEWGRGNDVAGYRDRRGWVLGDIVHSTPVVVGPPSDFEIEESYQIFQAAYSNRRKMVYVGANDGMMHAFDADNGEEAWAFVPEFALPAFSAMADSYYCHRYSLDQTVSVKDVLLGGVWRTVLVSGGREGGSSLFALDITNPDSPSLLWQSDLPNGKKYHSEVEITSIGGTPVVVVGSGLDVDTGEAWLYSFALGDGSLEGSRLLSTDNKLRNKTTRPVVVDLNLDGETDLVYAADYLGSLWRMQTNDDPNPANWSKSELYAGSDFITADPVAAFGPNGDVYLYFGSGAYMEDADMLTVDQQSFFCIFDNHSGLTWDKKDLRDQTSSISDVTADNGWYVELWSETGERVTEQAVVVAETVIFTSFAPTLDACVAGGTSYLYQMKYDDGGLADDQTDPDDRSASLGEGIASYPVVDLTEGTVVVQSSDASINISPIASLYQRLTVRSWQESFDHVIPATAPVN
ncbi:MAG: PilC/PilY family type IV pilus protein [Candidatus Krumholzibacteria bacterium]|nr:PilC/PilY family type IV pilus protein [Candidatus Krumholzibacteria bacterium]